MRDPHESNLKGERESARENEREVERCGGTVAKSKAWLAVGAVRIYRLHNWKLGGDSLG